MNLQRLKYAAIILAGVASAAVSSTVALAWSMGGHRVTGVIAARTLASTAPRVAEAIALIMQSHPAAAAFETRMNDAGSDPRARLERLFAEIAQWPDEVRGGPFKQFHRGNWHTIGLPYFVPGFFPAGEPPVPAENMLSALRENARIAADTAASAADRAVALCWIFHLVGDLHQPLHAISLFSAEYPDGDRYGTQAWVLQPHGGDAVSLHYFWDSAIQRSQNMLEVEKTASQLGAAHQAEALDEMRSRPYTGPDSFERWTREESHRLAISDAYREGRVRGAADKKGAPRLTEDYAHNARTLAARRMALSGHRLAEVLRAIFTAPATP